DQVRPGPVLGAGRFSGSSTTLFPENGQAFTRAPTPGRILHSRLGEALEGSVEANVSIFSHKRGLPKVLFGASLEGYYGATSGTVRDGELPLQLLHDSGWVCREFPDGQGPACSSGQGAGGESEPSTE